MVDVDATIRAWLVSKPVLTHVAGDHIYAAMDLPIGYQAEDGPALLFTSQMTPSYPSKLLKGSVTCRCYGTDEESARELERALYDGIHDKVSSSIKAAHLETGGQILQEPNTGWYFVLSIYRFVIANP
jgi:hypothetical protein